MARLKLGTRLKVIAPCELKPELAGKIGIVVGFSPKPSEWIALKFTNFSKGHDCFGQVRGITSGVTDCYYLPSSDLRAVDVVHNGKTYRIVRKGKKTKK